MSEFGQVLGMDHNPARDAVTMDTKCACNASQTHALLVSLQDDWLLRFFACRFGSSTRRAPQSLQ